MKTFNDLNFQKHPHADSMAGALFGGFSTQARLFFNNGYGVSVVQGNGAYGKYEAAVLKGDEKNSNICYSTPITDDVIGCDSTEEITRIMKSIQSLQGDK